MRFRKSTFWVQKVGEGVPHLPKFDPSYGPGSNNNPFGHYVTKTSSGRQGLIKFESKKCVSAANHS